jgi:S1-C subfamily serine protease
MGKFLIFILFLLTLAFFTIPAGEGPDIFHDIRHRDDTSSVGLEADEHVEEEPSKDIPEPTPSEEVPIKESQVTPRTSPPTLQAPSTTPPAPDISSFLFSNVNPEARKALVNVICELRTGNHIKRTTGSGILLSNKGLILTNSHVAYLYFLDNALDADSTSCSVRTGNPATTSYEAVPLFLSLDWVKKNAQKLGSGSHSGTGENDYALLIITEENTPTLPYLHANLKARPASEGDAVLTIAYPAEFLLTEGLHTDLYLTSDTGFISGIFTFDSQSLDLVTIKDSILAQKGASGGAVVDKENQLLGLIVTSSREELLTERELGALTLRYINDAIREESGTSLQNFISLSQYESPLRDFERNESKEIREIFEKHF